MAVGAFISCAGNSPLLFGTREQVLLAYDYYADYFSTIVQRIVWYYIGAFDGRSAAASVDPL